MCMGMYGELHRYLCMVHIGALYGKYATPVISIHVWRYVPIPPICSHTIPNLLISMGVRDSHSDFEDVISFPSCIRSNSEQQS